MILLLVIGLGKLFEMMLLLESGSGVAGAFQMILPNYCGGGEGC